jgi:hypothetical protein
VSKWTLADVPPTAEKFVPVLRYFPVPSFRPLYICARSRLRLRPADGVGFSAGPLTTAGKLFVQVVLHPSWFAGRRVEALTVHAALDRHVGVRPAGHVTVRCFVDPSAPCAAWPCTYDPAAAVVTWDCADAVACTAATSPSPSPPPVLNFEVLVEGLSSSSPTAAASNGGGVPVTVRASVHGGVGGLTAVVAGLQGLPEPCDVAGTGKVTFDCTFVS